MNGGLLLRCRCGDLAHLMGIWFDPDETDPAYGVLDISMVIPWMPWRYRIRQAWNVLRGRPGTVAWIVLEIADVTELQAYLAAYQAQCAAVRAGGDAEMGAR